LEAPYYNAATLRKTYAAAQKHLELYKRSFQLRARLELKGCVRYEVDLGGRQ
jgi:hypothetical protein